MKIPRFPAVNTAQRILRQFRHDPRSLALIVFAPALLLTILKYVYLHNAQVFQHAGSSMLGIFPMLVMFLLTSVTTLRERTSGTLDRLLVSPLRKVDFIAGYAIAFALLSLGQALIVSAYAIGPLGLRIHGSYISFVWLTLLDAWIGMSIGLLVSSFAHSEFQAIQFLPAILLPQLLLSGVLTPRNLMPNLLYQISKIMPMSYAVDATGKIATGQGSIFSDSLTSLGFIFLLLALGSLTLRRASK